MPPKKDLKILKKLAGQVEDPKVAKAINNVIGGYEKLERETREQEEIGSLMVHDTRRPLMGVTGYAGIIAEKTDNPEIRELAKIIEARGFQASALMGLFGLSRINNKSIKKYGRPIDYFSLIVDAIETLYSGNKENKEIVLYHPKGLEKEKFCTNESATTSIISNLIGNSLKYSEKDSRISIRTGLESAKKGLEKRLLAFEIENRTDRILTEEEINMMFNKGHRLKLDDPSGHGGNIGLGLYMLKKLVKQGMGGKIECYSDSEERIPEELQEKYEILKVGKCNRLGKSEKLPLLYIKILIPEMKNVFIRPQN